MLDQISAKFQSVLGKLWREPRLTEAHVDEALRELRLALLEADVHFRVVKDFCSRVREKAVGEEVLKSLTASQQVLKILRDELVQLLGGGESGLDLSSRFPAVVVLAGLNGAGKTTTTAKLGRHLKTQGRHPALVSVDVHRPAALEQLAILARQADLPCLAPESMEPAARAKAAVRMARDSGFDVLLVDTAGRLHVDEDLMAELKSVVASVEPVEILFVADSMTGQDAVKSAEAFGAAVPLTGHVLTKLDGDARGGAALSIVAATGRPIKYAGVSEKLDGLEPFRPDRLTSRLLGMGDVMTLIERAEESFEKEKAIALARKMRREDISLEDFREQLRQVKRMGSLKEILSLLPGASQLPMEVDEKELTRFEAILNSMTRAERENPSLIDGSRRRRIAKGSGAAVSEVNRLLRRFAEARKMVRTMARSGGMGRMLARLR